jgi:hypothetical protein
MNARALIIVGAVSAFFPGQVWAIGCVIEPSPVDCTIGQGSRYISPPAPVYSPPARVSSACLRSARPSVLPQGV